MKSSQTTCILCREKADFCPALHLSPADPTQVDLDPAQPDWSQPSEAICELLKLDPLTYQDYFLEAGYCSPCRALFLRIDTSLRSLRSLKASLADDRARVESVLRENYEKCCRNEASSAADFELLTSLNLTRTNIPLVDEYDFIIKRIYEGLASASVTTECQPQALPPLVPPVIIKVKRKSPRTRRVIQKKDASPIRNRVLRKKPEFILPELFSESGTESDDDKDMPSPVNSDPEESNDSSGDEGLNISEFEEASGEDQDQDDEWTVSKKVPGRSRSKRSETAGMTPTVVQYPSGPRFQCGAVCCGFSCKNETRMKVHTRSQHQGNLKPFKCDQCDFRFENLSRLTRHRKRHTKKPTIFCSVCNKGFYENWYLKRHLQTAHSAKTKLECRICSKSYADPKELESHARLHELGDGISLACLFCDLSFTTSLDLQAHVGQEHEVPKCTACSKVFVSDKKLDRHLRTVHAHSESELFKCTLCPFVCKYRSAYVQHLSWHSSNRHHVCETCGKSYKSAHCLKHHKRTHSGERPYECKECPKVFTSSSKLKNHVETHNPTKSYVCELCGKSYRARKNLSQHAARHRKGIRQPAANPRKRIRTKITGVSISIQKD